MADRNEILLFSLLSIVTVLFVATATGVELPGSESTGFACSIPGVNAFVDCGNTDDSTEVEPRYDLETSIDVQGTDIHARFIDDTFSYETEKACTLCSMSIIGPNQELAFGGANQVEVNFQLKDSNGNLKADGSVFVGELGILEREEVTFTVDNQPVGDYTIQYEMTYEPSFGAEQTKTFTKNIRIPRRIDS